MCIFCILGSINPLLEYYPKSIDLPPFDYTFFLPDLNKNKTKQNLTEILIDEEAYKHIPMEVKQIIKNQETMFYPLRTEGDGNCLVRAISKALWGTEHWHELLRKKLCEEIEQNEKFYKTYFSYTGFTNELIDEIEEDWKVVIKQAKGDGSYLQAIHIFALSHIIKRPIILYAPDDDVDNFGVGATGVAGTFVPIRFDPKDCASKIPIAICWSSSFKNHFVPIVGFSGKPNPSWPIIKSAYNTIDNEKLNRYIHFEKKILDHNDHIVTKQLDESMSDPNNGNVIKRNCEFDEEEGSVTFVGMESLKCYDCQITFPKGANLEKKLNEILTPFEFEEWQIPRIKKLLINFSKRSEMDGSRVKEPSFICPCGFKHMVNFKNYDLYMDIRDCGIGWNYGENEIVIADRFLERFPFEPELRLQAILAVKKKNEMVRVKLLPEPDDEHKISVKMKCPSCYQFITFPKYQVDITCNNCRVTFQNPQEMIERNCPFECGGSMKFVKGKTYVSCDSCNKTILLLSCNRCNHMTGSPIEEAINKEFIPCLSCNNKMITPFHPACKKPKSIFPYNEYLYCKGTNSEQMINIIKKNNSKISEPYNLNEKELNILTELAKKIPNEKSFFTEDEINIFLEKLFFWSFPSIVPCIDLFKLMLLNNNTHKFINKLNFSQRANLLVDIAFRFKKEKDSWKTFLVASQCLINNFSISDKFNNPTYFNCLDNVLKFVDYSLETKNTQIYIYISKILLNFSIIPSKFANFESRSQLCTFLIISVFPFILNMRDDFIKQTLKLGPKPTNVEDPNLNKIITDLAKNLSNLNESLFALFLCLGNILFHESTLVKNLSENGISSLIERVFEQGALVDKSWDDNFRSKVENCILDIILK